ncbi:unnamed protein product [Urochloa humidicola]
MPLTPAAATTVGHRSFINANPCSDRIHALWCADAASTAVRFSFALAACSDHSMGNTSHASLVLRSGALAFLFMAPYVHGAAATASLPLPSFSTPATRRFPADHGLTVRADAEDAFRASRCAPGVRARRPRSRAGSVSARSRSTATSCSQLPYVSHPVATDTQAQPFLLGYENVIRSSLGAPPALAVLRAEARFDHVIGNVPDLAPEAAYGLRRRVHRVPRVR